MAHWKDDHAEDVALTRTEVPSKVHSALGTSVLSSTRRQIWFSAVPPGGGSHGDLFPWALFELSRYLKTQVSMLERARNAPTTLADLVDVVAVADGLESFMAPLKFAAVPPLRLLPRQERRERPGVMLRSGRYRVQFAPLSRKIPQHGVLNQ
jgi:hypothetical protein